MDENDMASVGELRNRVSIAELDGNVLSRWGRFPSQEPGQFFATHGIWADLHGDIYVGEVLGGQRLKKFRRVRQGWRVARLLRWDKEFFDRYRRIQPANNSGF